uniref:hypothetical protein n=1 Tax=Pseudomonas fluorescens TaxID=294 RepID=UPI00130D8340|nr:hypothetical protein [Pseudomonas fluorescens]
MTHQKTNQEGARENYLQAPYKVNVMRKIKVCNYEILNFEEEPLVHTSVGLARITSPGVFSILRKMFKIKAKKYRDFHTVTSDAERGPLPSG